METGRFKKPVKDFSLIKLCAHLFDEPIVSIERLVERYGTEEEDVREYDVYLLTTALQERILKKTEEREIQLYERYLCRFNFNVPRYYGRFTDGKDNWILLENIEGEDLRDMTDSLALSAADTLAAIQNSFWGSDDSQRFVVYWNRINKRADFLEDGSILKKAYNLFLKRQKTCPRTCSHGDFLQFNMIAKNDLVYAIDWGFGGVMPYSLDIARFIAHGTEDKATFPFYMNAKQKELFVRRMYERLNQKPDYERYIKDIKLAVLNEYVEFIEADEDENGWYWQHAHSLAQELLNENADL